MIDKELREILQRNGVSRKGLVDSANEIRFWSDPEAVISQIKALYNLPSEEEIMYMLGDEYKKHQGELLETALPSIAKAIHNRIHKGR